MTDSSHQIFSELFLNTRESIRRITTDDFIVDTSAYGNYMFKSLHDLSPYTLSQTIRCNMPFFDGYLIKIQDQITFKLEVVSKPPQDVLEMLCKLYNCTWEDHVST